MVWGLVRVLFVIVVGGALFISAAVVSAHAELLTAEPAPGIQLTATPPVIKLVFSEPLGDGSTFTLFDTTFEQISVPIAHDKDAPTTLLADNVPQLSDGVYTVQWLAVSQDGHPLSGSYEFSIGDQMLTSTLLAEGALNPPHWVGWLMVILALALPTAVYYWQKRQRP